MSSCLSGGGGSRTYGFELDIVPSHSSVRSSSPSSTLSESSNSPRQISTKRARTPRKRPNQTYTEAAALLSIAYPKVFPAKNLGKLCKHTRPFDSFSESPELLPAFPALCDSGFLIGQPRSDNPVFAVEPKPVNSLHNACWSPPCRPEPSSPGRLDDDGFDAESILDEETEEGIDSIMGNLSMDKNEELMDCNAPINPHFRSLMRFGLGGGKLELGFGLGLLRNNMHLRALRQVDDGEWWRSPKVVVREIAPKFKTLSSLSLLSEKKKKKKKKKKMETEEVKESPTTFTITTTTTTTASSMESLRSSLFLKLDYSEVVNEWSNRGSPFSDDPDGGSPESTADILARLSEIDLSLEAGSGSADKLREASVMRYKEKRRSRLSSKKIRYQVRKVNADKRPRMKGRFVKSPLLLQEAIDEMSLKEQE